MDELIYICFVLHVLQTFLSHFILRGKSLILSWFLLKKSEAHRGYVAVARLFQLINGEARTRALISTIFTAASPGGSCENVLDITLSLVSENYNSGIYKRKK